MLNDADLEDLRATAQRYADPTDERARFERDLAERGILHVDSPGRTETRLARLNADWTVARALEQTPAGADTGRSLNELQPELFGTDVLGLERLMGRNDLIDVLPRARLRGGAVDRAHHRAAGRRAPGAVASGARWR